MKKMIAEFKEFISRGNVLDMAVGIIIGSAFTAIVNSLVQDVFMPFFGWIFGRMNFADFKIVLSPAVGDVPENAISYGMFIQNILNFLLIALVVFLMVKGINAFHNRRRAEEAKEEAPPAAPSEEILLLREIRDSLKAGAQQEAKAEEDSR